MTQDRSSTRRQEGSFLSKGRKLSVKGEGETAPPGANHEANHEEVLSFRCRLGDRHVPCRDHRRHAATRQRPKWRSGQTGGSVAFVRDARNAGEFEVQSGSLALERSQQVGVRGYASQTLKDAADMLYRVKFTMRNEIGHAWWRARSSSPSYG